MHVGTLYAKLHIPHARSLKDKRQVVRSILDRARARLRVAAAEIGENDIHQIAELGFSSVSGDYSHAKELVSKVLETLRLHPEALLIDHNLDVL